MIVDDQIVYTCDVTEALMLEVREWPNDPVEIDVRTQLGKALGEGNQRASGAAVAPSEALEADQ
jgi:hypothetical protein